MAPILKLDTKVKAPENHRKKQMAGTDPEQSPLQRVGGGKRCWHWVSSKPNWENMKMVTIWSLLVMEGEAGRWSVARAPTAGTLVPQPFNHTSLRPSDDPATHTGWPLSKWHFQIMGCSRGAGPYLCRSVFIKQEKKGKANFLPVFLRVCGWDGWYYPWLSWQSPALVPLLHLLKCHFWQRSTGEILYFEEKKTVGFPPQLSPSVS